MRGPSKEELVQDNERLRIENSLWNEAMHATMTGGVVWKTGKRIEGERYKVGAFGLERAHGGALIQIVQIQGQHDAMYVYYIDQFYEASNKRLVLTSDLAYEQMHLAQWARDQAAAYHRRALEEINHKAVG